MPDSLQLLIVLALVGGAAGYLGRQTWRVVRGRKSGCGSGCGKCSAQPATSATLVSLNASVERPLVDAEGFSV